MRKLFGSGSSWEKTLGYSRAVQVNDTLYISATSAAGPDGTVVGEGFYDQSAYILGKLEAVHVTTTSNSARCSGNADKRSTSVLRWV